MIRNAQCSYLDFVIPSPPPVILVPLPIHIHHHSKRDFSSLLSCYPFAHADVWARVRI
jgi:hypothetical protein